MLTLHSTCLSAGYLLNCKLLCVQLRGFSQGSIPDNIRREAGPNMGIRNLARNASCLVFALLLVSRASLAAADETLEKKGMLFPRQILL